MPKFKVEVYHEEEGYVMVTADSAEEAEEIVNEEIETNGLTIMRWCKETTHNPYHRDYCVIGVEE